MTALLILAAVCYGLSGVVTAFLMETPYRLRTFDMFLVALFWPLAILLSAIDGRKP